MFSHYRSLVASTVALILVYMQSKGYIDNDLNMLLSGLNVLIFGSINLNNHIQSKIEPYGK